MPTAGVPETTPLLSLITSPVGRGGDTLNAVTGPVTLGTSGTIACFAR
jgi:hypothetical protein